MVNVSQSVIMVKYIGLTLLHDHLRNSSDCANFGVETDRSTAINELETSSTRPSSGTFCLTFVIFHQMCNCVAS